MSTQYYYQPADLALDAAQIERRLGIDPTTYGSAGLTALGIYPVVKTDNPYNTALYTTTLSYTINGSNADETWTPTAKTLADVQAPASVQRGQTTAGRIECLRTEAGFGARIFIAVSGLTNVNRPEPFQTWMIRQQSTITDLGADLTAIAAAADVDAVNDIVSAAWGAIDTGYDPASPLDLLASDFTTDKFYSKNYAMSDLELYFPQTTTTVAYSGGFAATVGAFTANDHTAQLRVTATGVVIDEFCVHSTTTVRETEFGYRKYLDIAQLSSF